MEKEIGCPTCPAIIQVTDFNDQASAVLCRLSALAIFAERRIRPPDWYPVNDVKPYSLINAAYILYRLTKWAPPETIFVGVIDPGVGTERRGVIIQTEKHFLIGPDNGIFWPAARRDGITAIWQIYPEYHPRVSYTFHGRDIFSPAAAQIACGDDPSLIGRPLDRQELVPLDFRAGQVVHIDGTFGNYKIAGPIPDHPRTVILYHPTSLAIPFVNTFADVGRGELLAYSGSDEGFFEIAVNEGNAAERLGYRVGDCLRIEWRF
jgi:S-adenosylmethionine hydrolase